MFVQGGAAAPWFQRCQDTDTDTIDRVDRKCTLILEMFGDDTFSFLLQFPDRAIIVYVYVRGP